MRGIWVVIPAAGRGTRFGGEVPKQYLEVGGQSVLAWTLAALLGHPLVEGAVVAVSADDPWWPGWTAFGGKPVLACVGGGTRAASVLAALQALPEHVRADDFVLVHDAARAQSGRCRSGAADRTWPRGPGRRAAGRAGARYAQARGR
ncbi:2-C-methyl-D-erythritol 4-phosphate cytidylyltransferase [Pseudoxanthomonas winnipegensis]|nr:2-C-methyl-D-erythritol 4-phosphate cytidylyltransferase [Pseudoxanthomonas winnipegensis]